MIYKFKSKDSGDVIMLEPHGSQLLALLGREPAARGIIEVNAMPAALAALQAAIDADEAALDDGDEDADEPTGARAVALRQRLWPMVEMLRRAHAGGVPVVWGV